MVFEQEGEVQVLDPDTLQPVTLVKPGGFDVQGESLFVVKIQGALFILPYPN